MRGYRLILFMLALLVSVGMKGQYDPTSPPEPGVYHTLRLEATPTDGGRFNIGSTQAYSAGSRVSLRAYANSSFRFVAWEENGYVVSTSSSFTYTMPSADVTLTARFVYDPSSPAEPPMPDLPVYSTITLSASPTDGGRFNIGSSARYEVGSRVLLSAYAASNFAFTCWTEGADTVSTSSSFYYTVGETDTHLVANFAYTPGNPDEPSAPVVAHKLFIESSPAGGGTFNIGSGSSFIEGDMVPLYAHKNQWYTFTAWTIDGDTVSTDELLIFTMPDHDVTITANFTYDYKPSNPGEPSQGAGGVNIYGMTESGMRGQTVAYPVYLENSTPVSGMAVDMKFPQGFSVDASAVTLAGRAAGHSLAVTALEDNTYRFEITGEADFSGTNGKLFDVEVGIPDTATMNRNYTVELSHGVAHTTAGTHEAVPVRSGCIYVERLTEDGLYARFSFDKLLNRVQFSNQSSAKATTFHWNFGDGTESTEANPLHTYAAPGYYDVTLTAYGEHGEDVAQATILVNDSAHWTLDGTFLLTDKATGVRHFTSPDELLAFVSCASVTGNTSLQVATDSTFTLSLTPENTTRLDALADRLASQSLSLRITGGSQASTPRLGIGSEGDTPTAELVALYNALAEVSTCDGVDMSLCGVGYNPSRIEDIADQTVKSGAATAEMDFTRISQELTFAWELTEKPDSADVAGYETAGEGNIPAMFIDNIGDTTAVLTYSVTGSYGGLQFCRFTKTITVTPGTATLDEAEWQLLVELRETLAAGGWPTPWDMSCGAEGAATLDGVTLSRGHVVGIDLSGQSLGGTFEKGDADFVGGVAATDLQATILYIFGEYAGRPFNFTAADTYPDDVVNVQDVVATVGLLLRAGPAAGAAHSPARGGGAGAPGSAAASIYASGGVVYLQSDVPVAALHIASPGGVEWHLARYGMEQAEAGGDVVGYSLSGLALPAGLTAIGTCQGPVAITAASLSDAGAHPVDVSFRPSAPTGMGGVAAGGGEPAVYDARGVRRTSPGKGLNIIKAGKKAAKVINK